MQSLANAPYTHMQSTKSPQSMRNNAKPSVARESHQRTSFRRNLRHSIATRARRRDVNALRVTAPNMDGYAPRVSHNTPPINHACVLLQGPCAGRNEIKTTRRSTHVLPTLTKTFPKSDSDADAVRVTRHDATWRHKVPRLSELCPTRARKTVEGQLAQEQRC